MPEWDPFCSPINRNWQLISRNWPLGLKKGKENGALETPLMLQKALIAKKSSSITRMIEYPWREHLCYHAVIQASSLTRNPNATAIRREQSNVVLTDQDFKFTKSTSQ
jgi:hypothetical protein